MKTGKRNNLLSDFLKYCFLYFSNVYDLQANGKLFSAGQELQMQSPLSQTENILWGFPGFQPTRSNSLEGAAV